MISDSSAAQCYFQPYIGGGVFISAQQQDSTKKKIILATIELIKLHGFDKVTIAMIAKAVNLKSSSIYNYYKSKEMILHGVMHYISNLVHIVTPSRLEIAHELETKTPKQILERHCYVSADQVGYVLTLCKVFYTELFSAPGIPQMIIDIWSQYCGQLRAVLDHLVELEAIPSVDSRTLSQMWTRTRFVFSIWYSHDEFAYVEQYKQVTQLFLKMATEGTAPLDIDHDTISLPVCAPFTLPPPKNTKDKIIREAFALFCKNGYEKTTISQIAAKVGINPSGIYNHYENKDELLQTMIKMLKSLDLEQGSSFQNVVRHCAQEPDIVRIAQGLANGFLFADEGVGKECCRFYMHEQYRNDDIRYFYLGRINDYRCRGATVLRQFIDDGRVVPCDCYSFVTIYLFIQCSINIENAVLDKSCEVSGDFRIKSASILASVMINGVGKAYRGRKREHFASRGNWQ